MEATNKLDRWPYAVSQLTREEIDKYVVDEDWQKFRRNLKGKPTEFKLHALKTFRSMLTGGGRFLLDRPNQVRIDNYINALKRGGQLDSDGNIVK